MFQRKPRRFRHHRNGRGQQLHGNGSVQTGLRSHSFSNSQTRNNFRTTQSAEKLLEKYNALAKEAMTSGDKTLGENYLQHADHFMRIIEDKNKNQSKVSLVDIPVKNNENLPDSDNISKNSESKKKD